MLRTIEVNGKQYDVSFELGNGDVVTDVLVDGWKDADDIGPEYYVICAELQSLASKGF
jgi:hypothetical protein